MMFRSSSNTEDSGAIYTPDIIEAANSQLNATINSTHRTQVLEERLHEIMVFELRENGASEYSTMSLRGLYNYVVRCIGTSCREGKKQRLAEEERQRTRCVRFEVRDEANVTSTQQEDHQGDVNETPLNETPRDDGLLENNPPHLPSLSSSSPASEHRHNPQPSNNSHSNNSQHSNNNGVHESTIRYKYPPNSNNTSTGSGHHQKLGGYLHPRDMRRLVTPFSSSNEPQLIVRRHVMLLNFDPLRAIVLRDRVLVLVPDGADSILITLEKRVRGGLEEMEKDVFGDEKHLVNSMRRNQSSDALESQKKRLHSHVENETEHTAASNEDDEWEEIPNIDWSSVPYELLSVDAVLQTVTTMLADEARGVKLRTVSAIRELRGDTSEGIRPSGGRITGMPGDHAQERLRWLKDEINAMVGRIQGFVRALNEMLDEDEDMALMNLSRLLSHPERFVQPVSPEVLAEESDEPELILEACLQQALSIVNELELLKAQIMTTQEQISMTLDAMRNKLLYINTLLSLASLVVALGSFIGSIFGMNLHNPYEDDTDTSIWFLRVTIGTSVGLVVLFFVLAWVFYRQTSSSTDWRKKSM